MVLVTDEKTPLRVVEEGDRRRDDAASSGADRHHAHRVSQRNADAAALRPDAFPAVDDADAEHRLAIRGVMRSMVAAATMAATAAALVVVVWTQRTHTLQDSWRPVPGVDLHATFAADEGVAGTFAGGAGPADAEAMLGAGQKAAVESKAPFYMDDDAYRAYAPLLACVAESAAYTPLGVDLALFESLATHPWRVLEPCEASVFVVPALPASIPTSDRLECAEARLDPAALRAAALASARRSPHFAARGGEDHAVFASESGDAFFAPASAKRDEAREISREGKGNESRRRSLLGDARDGALFPEGVAPQYYRTVQVAERPRARRAAVDAVKARSAGAAGLGAGPVAEAPRRVAGRWGRAPGLRPRAKAVRVAALGDGAPKIPSGAHARLSRLLEDAAERARGGLGEGEMPSSACAGDEPGALASLGSAPRPVSRRAGLGNASDLVRELIDSGAARPFDPSDPEALVHELTAPKKASVKATFPADPDLKEVEIGGSVVPPEETFALPGEASAGDVAVGDDAPIEAPVEVGGSIAPPENAEEEGKREEEDIFEDPLGAPDEKDNGDAIEREARRLEDTLEAASDDVNREAAEEEARKFAFEEEPEEDVSDESALDGEDSPDDAPEGDADDAPANKDEGAEADESEVDALRANGSEAESRAAPTAPTAPAAPAAAGELDPSRDEEAESSAFLAKELEADVGMNPAPDDSREQLAERVAELLRPRVGMGGLDGAGAGSPLVNINVNTNTGGVTSLGGGGGGGGGGEVSPGLYGGVSPEAASASAELYARLMQALGAKGGGGELDASLRDAAARFADELAKRVPTTGARESFPPRRVEGTARETVGENAEDAARDGAELEALPDDRLDDAVTSAAKAAGLDDLLHRAELAAARGDAHVSEAKDGVPGRALAKAVRNPLRASEVSRASLPTQASATRAALDEAVSTGPADAELEALRARLEKAERDETAFAARLEADELDIPDARREFLVEGRARMARERGEDETRKARARAWTAPDPLDEDPEGAEMAGIDGVIRTAEAMSEVWAADPKMRVGEKADEPAAVAGRTDVLRANVPLRDDSRLRRKKSTLGETKRVEDLLAGDETDARTAVGSLLRELGV